METNKNLTISNNNLDEDFKDDFFNLDFNYICKVIWRRRRIAFLAALSVFSLAIIRICFLRVYYPTYKGDFSILISDPLGTNNDNKLSNLAGSQGSSGANLGGNVISSIVQNSSSTDIPTIIALLKSSYVISEIAEKYNMQSKELAEMIFIKRERIQRFLAKGIINVSLEINDLEKGKSLLDDLSKKYISISLQLRQEKINEGINFLNKQEPLIKSQLLNIQDKLKTLRKTYIISSPSEINLQKNEDEDKMLIEKISRNNSNLRGLNSIKEFYLLELTKETSSWKIVSPPSMGENPIEPKILPNLIFAVFISILSSLLAVFVKHKRNNVFDNSRDIKKYTNISNILEVPNLNFLEDKFAKSNIIDFFEKSFYGSDTKNSEERKKLYSKNQIEKFLFQITSFENSVNKKIILMGSSIRSEGKTLLCILNAFILSKLGYKVLLVDWNFEAPTLQKKLNIENKKGLSDLLVGDVKNKDEIIKKVPNQTNLNIITPGSKNLKISFNESKNVDLFLSDINSDDSFDFVFIDAPAFSENTYSLTLTKFVDLIIFVVSLNSVKKEQVSEHLSSLDLINTPIAGFIANNIYPESSNNIFNEKIICLIIKVKNFLKLDKLIKWVND